MTKRKLLEKILRSQKNVSFDDFVSLVQAYGFRLERVSGSHHIFKRADLGVIVNIQNAKGEAKPYQIKQFFAIVELNNLHLKE
ncbi:MAG: type II toxin-antitoxin system HicA family toxin [Candidatus Kapaibacterium sp.]|jgi:predicted RNA binding protein YcfA (HicA-like mRNA interferase family)